MCGLCGFLYKDPGRYGPVGHAMFDMLTPLDRRGTDSTGVALYGPPQDDSYVLRVRMEANGDTPGRVHDALAGAGAVSEESHTGGNLRARIGYAGDLGTLTDLVEVAHSHPFWARPFADISVVHNGHITNYHKLRRRLAGKGHRFATGNDSEAIAVYIADKLEQGDSLEDALRSSVHDLDGTFAYLISTPQGIGVARDRFALKP